MTARIFVCDDEQDILDITGIILEAEGFIVETVLDSLSVIEKIENNTPDLLLVDLWMPGRSGDQIVRQLREHYRLKDLPIVVISASRDGREIALNAGANDFLEKPYDIDHLIKTVQRHLPPK